MTPSESAILIAFGLVNVLIIAAFVLGKYFPLHRINQPACRWCGYPVTGLESFICPECGKDLRRLGISTPNARAFRKPVALWWLFLLWTTFAIPAATIIGFSANNIFSSSVHEVDQSIILSNPKSGAYDHVLIAVKAHGIQWFWQQNMTWNNPPNRFGDTGDTSISIFLHPGTNELPAAVVNFDSEDEYTIVHSKSYPQNTAPPGSVFEGITQAFRESGINTNLPAVQSEIKELFSDTVGSSPGLLVFQVTTGNSSTGSFFTSKSILSSVDNYYHTQWIQYPFWLLAAAVWIFGLIHLYHRYSPDKTQRMDT